MNSKDMEKLIYSVYEKRSNEILASFTAVESAIIFISTMLVEGSIVEDFFYLTEHDTIISLKEYFDY